MKKLSILISSFFVIGIFVFDSCSKTGDAGPTGQTGATGPAGPVLNNTVTGYVFLYDAYGDPVTTGLSTAYALLYNTSTGALVDSITANAAGQYTGNIQTGTYNLVGKCPGYGISETQNIVFTGGTRNYDIKFAAIPILYVATGYDSIGTNNVYIKGTVTTPNPRVTTLLVYVGTTSSVNASIPSSYSFVVAGTIATNNTRFSIALPLSTISDYFAAGSNAYIAIYGAANNYTYGDYTDYASGNLVYTPISVTSFNPGSFIVP